MMEILRDTVNTVNIPVKDSIGHTGKPIDFFFLNNQVVQLPPRGTIKGILVPRDLEGRVAISPAPGHQDSVTSSHRSP